MQWPHKILIPSESSYAPAYTIIESTVTRQETLWADLDLSDLFSLLSTALSWTGYLVRILAFMGTQKGGTANSQ